MPSEQHLPYRSVADVVVLDGDGSRWVREDVSRKPIRKVEAYLVVDFGGSFGGAWENPVRAFTDYGMAKACKRAREQRRIDPGDEVFCPYDYVGSYIKNIEVVIDVYDE